MKPNTKQTQAPVARYAAAEGIPVGPSDIRVVHTPPREIRDFGRVKIGDGGTAPVRRPSRERK